MTTAPAQQPPEHGRLWHHARDLGDNPGVINRELSKRLAAGRDRRLTQLADAAARWGGHVPEDPGITELADLLETAAADTLARPGAPGHPAKALLAGAVENLRAAARLGGHLPAVTLWHLQRAIDQEHTAHQQTVPAQRQGRT
ncbi:hypothetical protein [Streptomyces sp. OspMP-M43]|uniref:hypothetical protein n=1 Tax=Streptomyces sp. OspMP-M43 TaxID=1839781 RepID=UPI00081AFBA3|nr:hypothetical protein [Streptomyces sp. OspMP-M43]SCE59239.1 hypothetical protein GA0115261_109204 [Streptomyces sp. OspMP-M43]